ncbi:MAG: hypothetical protein ACLQIB_16005 [Isosphaeraceae bacterium]
MDTDHANREHEQDLSALANRLTAWRPSTGALDRDRMLYEAGRAAARAEAPGRPWRLATAALAVAALGLFGLLVHERSLRVHERFVLAQERSRHSALGRVVAVRIEGSAPSADGAAATPAIEPLSPSSYFVLASRLSKGVVELSSPDFGSHAGPHRPAPGPLETIPQPAPLRPGDVERVLDL